MDEHFEKRLNEKVLNSYAVKTKAEDILSAYHAKEKAKRRPSYKVPFFSALGVLACAIVALAVVIPLGLSDKTAPSTSSLDSLSDINVSPLKSKEGTLAYEVTSVYPLLKRLSTQKALVEAPLFKGEAKDKTEEKFENCVDGFEKVQASVREAFLGKSENLVPSKGSFIGEQATYDYQVLIPNVGSLLYSLDASSGNWSRFQGEVNDEEKNYALEGRTLLTKGVENLTLTLRDNGSGDYVSVEQNKTRSTFFFSYDVFKEGLLSYTFSLALLQTNSTTPAIMVNYYFSEEGTTGSFRVVWKNIDIYEISASGFNKILLTYKNNERIYTYSTFEITEQ